MSGRSWEVTRTTSLSMTGEYPPPQLRLSSGITEHLVGFQKLSPTSSRAMASPCRCGRLAFHIQLPYSFLHFPFVESAIRFTHSKDFCGNCSLYANTTQEVRSRDARCSQAPFFPLALRIGKKTNLSSP